MPSAVRLSAVLAAGWLWLGALTTALAEITLPSGEKLETIDFERHVMGLFSKTGCNNGSCHGSFQGKNGFRLSLFGYEPEKDFAAITRESLGRRLDRVHPEASLLLQKGAGLVRHEGGARFGRDSWQYQVFREWIRQGAVWTQGSGEVVELKLSVPEYVRCDQGQTLQLTVRAKFSDGSEEAVTAFCDYRVADDAIATVSPSGVVSALRPGDTGLAVLYRGQVRAVRILVPTPTPPGFVYPKVPEVNFVDREVFAKLRLLNMVPSELSSDTEFLRRVTIDTIGTLPTPEEIRAFVQDSRPDKRERKIDELLRHPAHAALWATKFSDITGNNTNALEQPQALQVRRSQAWHDWFKARIAANVPYDQIVHDVLCATSRDGMSPEQWIQVTNQIDDELSKGYSDSYPKKKTLDLFWRRQQNVPIEQWGEKVAAAFLGVRLECAQCHKHPTDRWTQADYRAFANLFAQVAVGQSPEARKVINEENAERKKKLDPKKNANQQNIPIVRELYLTANPKTLPHPETNKPLPPRALGGPVLPLRGDKDVREELFQWMRQPDNPFFARSFVNRVWAHYFGIGLVDPVDDFSQANPPSNARLLDALAKSFIDSGFDIRQLEKTILLSRTYQLSATPNDSNRFDRNNYSHAYVRPMMAEVVVDVLNAALGVEENFDSDAPAGRRMIDVGSSRLNNANLAYALRIFGRPPRTTACDCERTADPALPQTLFRMTDPYLLAKFRLANNRINTLAKSKKPLEEALEELFLATLSRLPNDHERQAFRDHAKSETNRVTLLTDTMWALINTREFILNH